MAATVTFSRDAQPWLVCLKDSSRPVLTGVLVDPDGFLVAADGFALACVPCRIEGTLPAYEGIGPIVPGAFLASNMPKLGRHTEYGFDVVDEGSVCIRTPDGEARQRLIDGSFPLWRKLVPQPADTPILRFLHFNPGLLQKVTNAISKQMTGAVVCPSDRNGGPYLVAMGADRGFGMVMPMHSDPPDQLLKGSLEQFTPAL